MTTNTQEALRNALEEIISLAPAGSLCQNKAKDLLAATAEPEQPALQHEDENKLTDDDAQTVLGLIAWLQGAAQGDRKNVSRGEAVDALKRLLLFASPQVREQPVQHPSGLHQGHCHKCGMPFVNNPHPEAGKPSHLLSVGCQQECLPCTVLSRHQWSNRAIKAEGELKRLRGQPAIQEGWKLVPVKPDQAMCQSGQWKAQEWPRFPLRITSIYQAMLEAAPSPENKQ